MIDALFGKMDLFLNRIKSSLDWLSEGLRFNIGILSCLIGQIWLQWVIRLKNILWNLTPRSTSIRPTPWPWKCRHVVRGTAFFSGVPFITISLLSEVKKARVLREITLPPQRSMCSRMIRWRQRHNPVPMGPTYPGYILPNKLYQRCVTILNVASNCWEESRCRAQCRLNHRLCLDVSCSIGVPSPHRSAHSCLHLVIKVTFLDSAGINHRLPTDCWLIYCNTPRSINCVCVLSEERRCLLNFSLSSEIPAPSVARLPILALMIY